MAQLSDLMFAVLKGYPFKDEMSNARLTKTIYLVDWHHLINFGSRATDISWYFDNYGPFVWDIKNTASENIEIFSIEETFNIRKSSKTLFKLVNRPSFKPKLSDTENRSVESVIDSTKSLYWDDFIRLVYSTYPIIATERYSFINLEKCAEEYNKLRSGKLEQAIG